MENHKKLEKDENDAKCDHRILWNQIVVVIVIVVAMVILIAKAIVIVIVNSKSSNHSETKLEL